MRAPTKGINAMISGAPGESIVPASSGGGVTHQQLHKFRQQHGRAVKQEAEEEHEHARNRKIAILIKTQIDNGMLLVELPNNPDHERRHCDRGECHDEVGLKPVVLFALVQHYLEWAEGQRQQCESSNEIDPHSIAPSLLLLADQMRRTLDHPMRQQQRNDSDRDVGEENPAPLVIVGDPSAQRGGRAPAPAPPPRREGGRISGAGGPASAAAASAYADAISSLSAGLNLVQKLPDSPERIQRELLLQLAVGPALMAVKGLAAPEAEQACVRAHALCERLGNPTELLPALFGRWFTYLLRGELRRAYEVAELLLRRAQSASDPAGLMRGHAALGYTSYYVGELLSAMEHLEVAISIYDPERHRPLIFRYGGADTGVGCLSHAAITLWQLSATPTRL
jgi:hypothetical protein